MNLLRRVAENWRLKLLAIALAVLLWVVVSAEQVTTAWLPVPLIIRNTDTDFRLESLDAPSEVEVRLSGSARDILDLILRRPSFVLSLSDIQNPVETRFLEPRMLQLPAQMEVTPLDVRPASVRLEFTRIAVKRVPVRARLAGQLGPEWAVVDTLVGDPGFIDLSGPSDLLGPISEVFTTPIQLSSADTIISKTVSIDTAGLAGIEMSADVTSISGRIDRVVERGLVNVPVEVTGDLQTEPEQVTVTLRGPRSKVVPMNAATIRVIADRAGQTAPIPPVGALVPLRVERLGTGVTATVFPERIRVLPPPVPEPAEPDSIESDSAELDSAGPDGVEPDSVEVVPDSVPAPSRALPE